MEKFRRESRILNLIDESIYSWNNIYYITVNIERIPPHRANSVARSNHIEDSRTRI